MTRTLTPLTSIPVEIWEATGIVLASAFTDLLDGGDSSSTFFYSFSGGSAATTF